MELIKIENSISRKKAREQAFILGFEYIFTNESIDEMIEISKEYDVVDEIKHLDEFAIAIVRGMIENKEEIDCMIESKTIGWKINRMSKVALTIIRLSVYQLLFSTGDIKALDPTSVIINEAVRITKKYSTIEDSAFVNGVLGVIAKTKVQDDIDKENFKFEEKEKPEDIPLD